MLLYYLSRSILRTHFSTLPKRAGSPASPLASPKFPPPRTASPLSRPVITGTPPTPITSSSPSASAFTGSSKAQNPHLTSSFESSTRVPTSRTVSPAPPSQSMVQPPPRTVTLDGSMISLGIGAGATAALTNTQVPPVASAPLPKSVGSPPVQHTPRSSSPATAPMIPSERRAEGQRMLTRSPSPLGSPAFDPSSQHSYNMSNMPTSRRDRAYSRASPSRPSADLRSAPDPQLPSEGSNFESLLPPARRTASPSSEVARSASSSPGVPSSLAASPLSTAPTTTQASLRKAQSTASLRSLGSRSSQGGALRPNFERPYPFGEESKSPMPPPVQPPSRRSSRFRSASRASSDRRPSIETTQSTDYSESVLTHSQQRTASTLDHDHGTSPPTSPVRAASLRSRRSFSQLRSKGIKPVREIISPTQVEFEEETIQVKDMEFELVKPIIRHREHRDSDESAAESKEAASPRTELRADAESIRSHSPALLAARSPDAQSPAASSVDSFPPIQGRHPQAPTPAAPVPQVADVNHEAHRARELKWISSMSSIPSAQARKNKKIRKLLQDPVPDSVRYLVWAHVLDAKAKRIQNVYAQIGNRPKGPISEQIERDAERCFTQQPHLQDPKGPVISVVNAYLAMVPDIRYHPGKLSPMFYTSETFIIGCRFNSNRWTSTSTITGRRRFLDISRVNGKSPPSILRADGCTTGSGCLSVHEGAGKCRLSDCPCPVCRPQSASNRRLPCLVRAEFLATYPSFADLTSLGFLLSLLAFFQIHISIEFGMFCSMRDLFSSSEWGRPSFNLPAELSFNLSNQLIQCFLY
jgi:hypothetical protein